jgi:hypothetical protein
MDPSDISQVFDVDDIFILWQISIGYFKRIVHFRHERLIQSFLMKRKLYYNPSNPVD